MAALLQPGDRVEVVRLIHDPAPLAIGERGTVRHVWNEGGQFEQVDVAWDSGRSLMLVPEDYSAVRHIGVATLPGPDGRRHTIPED